MRGERAGRLFRAIERGEIEATTSEVVVHEVIFVLSSRRQYGWEMEEVVPRVRHLLNLRGMRFSSENLNNYNLALNLLLQMPVLEFADAIIAIRTIEGGHTLATLDSHFDRVDELPTWDFESLD
ncbi:MAG: type II toxin-antitoxin system VapC family toxin [Thermomicrobiales bacterium]